MGRIYLLPDEAINQIAAGEVVERPAAVVKELVENALDAEATQITVHLMDGGKDRISVLDNGVGMSEEDARLSIQRHATSKLRDAAGLAAIHTLGFRGEALASIAAVSRFELVTCADEQLGGFQLNLDGGRDLREGHLGFPRGTRVTVEELFFNTPARRKFLRTTATEFQHVQGQLTQLALAHPAVAFRLQHNERAVLNLPAGNTLAARVGQLFGGELAEELLWLEAVEPALRFEGLLSAPSQARASRRWQHLFVNDRPVRDASLNHAVYHAYRTLLMKGRHPAYVLKIYLDPHDVDVNVHPAKTEVRLRNPQLAHSILAAHIHKGLMDAGRRRAFGADAGATPGPAPRTPASSLRDGQVALPLRPAGTPLWAAGPWEGGAAGADPIASAVSDVAQRNRPRLPDLPPPPNSGPGASSPPVAERAGLGATDAWRSPVPATGRSLEGGSAGSGLQAHPLDAEGFHFHPLSARLAQSLRPGAELPASGGLAVLSQFANTYLLVQRGDALLIVDQHAAHERILFEQYRLQFYAGDLRAERLLIPESLELSPQSGILLEQYLPQWSRMGFEIEAFGKNTYLVRQVPGLLAGRDVKPLILDVLDELALFGKSGRVEEVFNEILERLACHSAIRAGDLLGAEERQALVGQLEHLDINLYCPHGRPVWVELSLRELERRFKRTV